MNNNKLKEMSILLAEIEAIKVEVDGMKVANAQRLLAGERQAYPETEFFIKARDIRVIIKKMQAIDTRPGAS